MFKIPPFPPKNLSALLSKDFATIQRRRLSLWQLFLILTQTVEYRPYVFIVERPYAVIVVDR